MSRTFPSRCFAFSSKSYNGIGPGMTFQEVLQTFSAEGINVTAFTPRLRVRPDNDVDQVQGLPPFLRLLPWRHVGKLGVSLAEAKFSRGVSECKGEAFVYIFPDLPLELVQQIAEAGVPIVREMIGLHRGTARRIMVEEHEREGLGSFDDISRESVELETKWLGFADGIFAPNEQVRASLIEHGIPPDKILDTSYGWSPTRFPLADEPRDFTRGLRLLFVGRVSFAKGAHLLLRAWHLAGCPGQLILAGKVEPELARRFQKELAHPSIERLGFVTNLGPVYASANAFALPTLFEGGPQVTLEAAAHGLPSLVSPMGTARIIRNSLEGLVIEPHDTSDWAAAIQAWSDSPQAMAAQGRQARESAQSFIWQEVSRLRARALKKLLWSSSAGAASV